MVGLFSTSAFALTITPTSGTLNVTRWESNDTGNCDAACVEALTGMTGLTEVYKQDVGGGESGSFAGDYTTTFANTPTDPEDATITWDGPNFIDCATDGCKAVVKDGNQIPAQYVFDLGALGWDGQETLEFEDFWPNQGAISHVALLSGGGGNGPGSGPTGQMPEPATTLLIGSGLLGFGLWRWNQNKK